MARTSNRSISNPKPETPPTDADEVISTSSEAAKSESRGRRVPRVALPRIGRRLKRRRGAEEVGLELRDHSGEEVVYVASPPIAASLRSMLTRMRVGEGIPTRLGLTSAIRGEGVTSVCRTLGLLLAHDAGQRVCIVDLNWWAPPAWPAAQDHQGGLADVLGGRLQLADALVPTDNSNLFVLPAGEASFADRPVLAGSAELKATLATLEAQFDHLLLDLPAVHATSETLALAEHASSLALVVRHGVTSESQVQTALEELDGEPILGVILNATVINVPRTVLRRIPSV